MRIARANLHREIAALPYRDGLRRVAALLKSPGESLRLDDTIGYIRRVGTKKTRSILSQATINPFRNHCLLRDLTPRERSAVAEILTRKASS